MNKGSIMIHTTIPSGQHTLKFIKPSEEPFDLPSSFITAQGATILCDCLNPVTSMWSNHFNTLLGEACIKRITVIGKIPNKSFGSSHSEGLIEGSLDKGDFMRTSRSRVQGEWKTMSVCNNHELRTFAPLGLSHFSPPFFATTKVPSIKHSDRSICPTSSRWRASASNICLITPAFTQLLKRRKQVEPDGNRSGKSAQLAPVRSTHKIPFNTARSLCTGGRPLPSARLSTTGINGSNMLHCASVSSSLLAMMIKYNHFEKNY